MNQEQTSGTGSPSTGELFTVFLTILSLGIGLFYNGLGILLGLAAVVSAILSTNSK